MLRTSLIAAVISVTAAVSASAATYQDEPNQVRVSMRGVDLTDPAQVQEFHATLRRAARQACDVPGVRDLQTHMAIERCVKDSLGQAVASVNAPLLTAYNASQSAQGAPVQLASGR